MTDSQSRAARHRYQRENAELCGVCSGTGRVQSQSAVAKAKRGGNASFLASLNPGRLSMSERGKLGGRFKEPTLVELQLRSS